MRILVVEDDRSIAEPLVAGLARHGFDPTLVTRGGEALDAAGAAELVLLDLGLPDLDGTEVCRRLREAHPGLPVIVISARGEEIDRVLLLETGADDYLVKPFGLRELVARIRAVTRRAADHAVAPLELELGELRLDRRARRVTVGDVEVELTPKEFELLAVLAADPGAVVERRAILERVWDPNWYGSSKTLDVHVAALRRKLGDPRWVRTVRGVGFCLEVPGDDGASGE